jgi:hypothetical protein
LRKPQRVLKKRGNDLKMFSKKGLLASRRERKVERNWVYADKKR